MASDALRRFDAENRRDAVDRLGTPLEREGDRELVIRFARIGATLGIGDDDLADPPEDPNLIGGYIKAKVAKAQRDMIDKVLALLHIPNEEDDETDGDELLALLHIPNEEDDETDGDENLTEYCSERLLWVSESGEELTDLHTAQRDMRLGAEDILRHLFGEDAADDVESTLETGELEDSDTSRRGEALLAAYVEYLCEDTPRYAEQEELVGKLANTYAERQGLAVCPPLYYCIFRLIAKI